MRIVRHLMKTFHNLNVKSHITCLVARNKSTYCLEGVSDRYNGVTVNINQLPRSTSVTDFDGILSESLKSWRRENRGAIWLQVPIAYSHFIATASQHGFLFHNAENQDCLLKVWLPSNRGDNTPRFATHQLGVCGVVLREDTGELLVVKEKKSQFSMWKFPGGLADLGEDIGDAAIRETCEETGVRTEFASVIAIRQQHQHPTAFGRSDLYVVCRLLPLTFDISPCDHEIAMCQWMPLETLRGNIQIASITHRITSLMRHGLAEGFDQIDLKAEEMRSVYKGLTFTLFHKELPE